MTSWIWLSHTLSEDTPVYGDGEGLKILPDKRMDKGDSCNTMRFAMPNHIGTHVDAPRHFHADGLTINQYEAKDWVFESPLLLDLNITEPRIITVEDVESVYDQSIVDTDLVLLRTGIEAFRKDERFWRTPPGFAPQLGEWISQRFPSCSAIGTDAISISSFAHREVGRETHRAFLSRGIRIFEDLALAGVQGQSELKRVFAMPLLVASADGCPVTMVGELA